jgi:TonB family protein
LFLLCAITLITVSASAFSQDQGAESPELEEAKRLNEQALTLFREGKLDEALPLAKRVLELRERNLSRDDDLVVGALRTVGDILFARKAYAEAESTFSRVLDLLEKRLGPGSQSLIPTLEKIAIARFAQGDNGGAEKFYLRVLSITEKAFGADSIETGRALGRVGYFYNQIEKYSKAADYFKRGVAIVEKTSDTSPSYLADLLRECACALLASNKTAEAKPYQEKADKIQSTIQSTTPVKKGGVLQGTAILRVEPVYPPQAKRMRVQGTVVVEVLVDECGRVVRTKSLSGHVELQDAAESAARQWRFSPTRFGDKPVKVIGTIRFNFSL